MVIMFEPPFWKIPVTMTWTILIPEIQGTERQRPNGLLVAPESAWPAVAARGRPRGWSSDHLPSENWWVKVRWDEKNVPIYIYISLYIYTSTFLNIYIYTYISIYIYMYIPFTLHVWTRASQGTSPQLHVRPMLWNDFGIVWGGAVTMIQQLQDWMDSGNATTRGWEYDWLKQIKTLHWYWWTDGCQILHQLVDDVSHDHPMIYSGL